ncbi:MAG: hypothetical protein P8176_11835 [Gammaproteobacteria bacterium]
MCSATDDNATRIKAQRITASVSIQADGDGLGDGYDVTVTSPILGKSVVGIPLPVESKEKNPFDR